MVWTWYIFQLNEIFNNFAKEKLNGKSFLLTTAIVESLSFDGYWINEGSEVLLENIFKEPSIRLLMLYGDIWLHIVKVFYHWKVWLTNCNLSKLLFTNKKLAWIEF